MTGRKQTPEDRAAELLDSYRQEEDPGAGVEDRLWGRVRGSAIALPFIADTGLGGDGGAGLDASGLGETPLGELGQAAASSPGAGAGQAVGTAVGTGKAATAGTAAASATGLATKGAVGAGVKVAAAVGAKGGLGALGLAGLGTAAVTAVTGAYLLVQQPSPPVGDAAPDDQAADKQGLVERSREAGERPTVGDPEPAFVPTEVAPPGLAKAGAADALAQDDQAAAKRDGPQSSIRKQRRGGKRRSANPTPEPDVASDSTAAQDHKLGAQVRSLSAIEEKIRRNEIGQAVRMLDRFDRRYPDSDFGEVSEALRTICRCQLGHADARKRGRQLLDKASTRKFAGRLQRSCGITGK